MPIQLAVETAAGSNVAQLAGDRARDQQDEAAGDHLEAAREQGGRRQDRPAGGVDRAERPADRGDQQREQAGRVEVVDARGRPGEDRDPDDADGDPDHARTRQSLAQEHEAEDREPHRHEGDQERGDAAGDRLLGPCDQAHAAHQQQRAHDQGVGEGPAARPLDGPPVAHATAPASRIPAGTNRMKPITNGGTVSTATLMPRYVEPHTR